MELLSQLTPKEEAVKLRRITLGGRAVAFIGSGISIKCYPSWSETIKELCDRCGVTITQTTNPEALIRKAEECKEANEALYYGTLKELFSNTHPQPRVTYDLLLKLKFKSYVTTNLDPLLAYKASIIRDELKCYVYPDLPYHKVESGGIFYIHGTVSSYAPVSYTHLTLPTN